MKEDGAPMSEAFRVGAVAAPTFRITSSETGRYLRHRQAWEADMARAAETIRSLWPCQGLWARRHRLFEALSLRDQLAELVEKLCIAG